MYQEIIAFFTLRTILVSLSSIFSIVFLMLAFDIITVDEVITLFNMNPEMASAFKNVVMRIQGVTHNLTNIVSELFKKLFAWTGADVDLEKVKAVPQNQ